MNYKNICIILSLLSLNWKVLSSPIDEYQEDIEIAVDDSFNDNDFPQETLGSEESSEEESATVVYDAEDVAEITDNIPDIDITDSAECLTPECYDTAKRILTSLDFSADPCNDFYQFSCGGWINEQKEEEIDPLTEDFHTIRERSIKILEGQYQPNKDMTPEEQEYDEKNFKKMQNLYNSCMNSNSDFSDEEAKMEATKKFVSELKYKENVDRYKTVDGLTDFALKIHDYNPTFMFGMVSNDLYFNLADKKEYITINGCVTFNIKECYESSWCVNSFRDFMKRHLLSYYDPNEVDIDKVVDAIVNVDRQISKYYDRNEVPVLTTLKELNENYPYFDWKKYFTKRFEMNGAQYKYEINDDTKIFNEAPHCLNGMNTFFQEVDFNELAYLAEINTFMKIGEFLNYVNLLMYFHLRKEQNMLEHPYERNNNDFEDINDIKIFEKMNKSFKFMNENILNGETNEEIDEEENVNINDLGLSQKNICYSYTNKGLGFFLGKFYVEKFYPENLKESIEDIIDNIKEAMHYRIPQMEWLDDFTRNYALEKVSEIQNNILYPDYVLDPKQLHDRFNGIEIGSEFFINVINLMKYTNNRFFLSQIEGSDVNDFAWVPTNTVNAYYLPDANTMIFPAGLLQPPLYYSTAPDYINYGGVGMAIGHELTHAFDSTGKKYDSVGHVYNWWTENDNEEFNEFSQCFIDQYGLYYIEDENGIKHSIDGQHTLDENLADNGGLSRAYEAWNISMSKDPEKAREKNMALPGLSNFTFDQLFYIAFGQSWCVKEKPETTMIYIKNEHSPNKVRVNGVVSNSKHFAKVFNCPSNTEMNPTDKCLIW